MFYLESYENVNAFVRQLTRDIPSISVLLIVNVFASLPGKWNLQPASQSLCFGSMVLIRKRIHLAKKIFKKQPTSSVNT